MNKISRTTKVFERDNILTAEELNSLVDSINLAVDKINEIVAYINGNWQDTDLDNPNIPINPEETWPEEDENNKNLFTKVTIPQDVYAEHFQNASSVRIVIVKSSDNSSWALHQYADTSEFHNDYSVYLPSEDTTLYYKIVFVDLDHGYSYTYPEIITR